MPASVRDYEAKAIARLVQLHLEGPDEWNPEHWDTAEEAARVASSWVRRDGRGVERQSKPKASRVDRDAAVLAKSSELVKVRSGGYCEVSVDGCTIFGAHIHHKGGRVGEHVHEPGMLLHVCLHCHNHIHANPEESYAEGWLVKRNGPVS